MTLLLISPRVNKAPFEDVCGVCKFTRVEIFFENFPSFFFSNFTQKNPHFFPFLFFLQKKEEEEEEKKVTTTIRYDDVAVGDETGRATTRAVTAVSSSDSTTASVVRARIESSSVVFSSGDIIDNSESVVAE